MPTRHGRRLTLTVDLIAVAAVMLGLLAGLIAWRLMPVPLSVVSLEQRFGPKRYSEQNEELLIRTVFNDRRYGVFVDVGSGHYQQGSNTYFLESELGWRGLAIDAIKDYAAGYAEHRPATRFFPLFISDRSNDLAEFFFLPELRTKSSGVRLAVDGVPHIVTEQVPTSTLDDLLGAQSITRFDFLSLDIELGEPAALRGLTIDRFRPTLVCVEAHEPVRAQIAAYFAAHHYRRLDDFLAVDTRNWYYVPQ